MYSNYFWRSATLPARPTDTVGSMTNDAPHTVRCVRTASNKSVVFFLLVGYPENRIFAYSDRWPATSLPDFGLRVEIEGYYCGALQVYPLFILTKFSLKIFRQIFSQNLMNLSHVVHHDVHLLGTYKPQVRWTTQNLSI